MGAATGDSYHPILTQVQDRHMILYAIAVYKQLVEAIFNPQRPDLTDLQYHAEGLTSRLKATFR